MVLAILGKLGKEKVGAIAVEVAPKRDADVAVLPKVVVGAVAVVSSGPN